MLRYNKLPNSISTYNYIKNLTMSTVITNPETQIIQLMKSYQADQQVKYLHLQAEIEVLLQQLQTLKQKRQSTEKVGQ
ncbi:MAG: hypothetical protein N5P05_003719 [Chroococcopsis gigantea SAG 12.99]|nr:hypothetical protein [Chroococcopsis gigantea SAG 12.99]